MQIHQSRRRSIIQQVNVVLLFLTSACFFAPLTALGGNEGGPPLQTSSGRIEFVGKNTFSTAEGVFHQWKIAADRATIGEPDMGEVVIEVSVASLDTDNQRRDDHLRSADFFEVERWPTARVRVQNASQTTPGRYQADFEVQIRDKIKTIRGEFEVIDRSALTVRGTLTIDRTDFGIGDPKNWNPMSIGNEIPVTFEVSLRG